ncbi:MAG TPA: DUF2283 domain-containing protein [Rhodothermales bacterium]|nr:DUF2283 domain-containing protein [Rhodothermales bacterium]
MRIEYWPDVDMLHIRLSDAISQHGHDAEDPDITVHFDKDNRLVEIEVSNASRRIDLDDLRRRYSFEEVRPEEMRA